MTPGVVRLQAIAGGLRGAKIEWLLERVEPSEDDFSGEPPTDTLVSYDFPGVFRPGMPGLAFSAWRCTRCKVVSFTYPQGNKHA